MFEHLADETRSAIAQGGIRYFPGVTKRDLRTGRARVEYGKDGVAYAVPVLRGADDVAVLDALDHVKSQLAEIVQKENAGEQIDPNEKETLVKQHQELEQLQGGDTGSSLPQRKDGESETDYLKRFKQEVEERTEARKFVEEALQNYASAESQRASRMKNYAVEAVKDVLGADFSPEDGGIDSAVKRILGQSRPASRFVGGEAEEAAAKTLAEGGGKALENMSHLRVGEDRGIKALQESTEKWPLGTYISLMNRRKYAILNDAEERYFQNLYSKALAEGTPSAGGVLVPREYMEDLLGLLRAQTVVRRAQPRFQRFQKEMYQTSVSTGATAFYTQENAQIPISEPSFAEAALLTPKNLTALVPVSNYLLNDAEQAEDFVRQDLAEVMALREDLAFLRGSGAAGEPRGFRNIVGITLDPIAPGAGGVRFTIAQLRRIRATFRSLNAGAVRPVWFFNPEFLTYLETIEEQSGGSPTGRTLLDAEIIQYDDDTLTSGRFDGIRFFSTTQLPNGTTGGNATTELYLVNMAETIVGENQELEVDVSREASYWDGAAWVSAFQNNQSVFRAVMRHDIAHRRPAQIVVQTGARTT